MSIALTRCNNSWKEFYTLTQLAVENGQQLRKNEGMQMIIDKDFVLALAKIVLWMTITLTAGMTIGSIFAYLKGKDTADAFARLVERGEVLRIVTVMAIVISTTLLGLINTLDAPAISAILGGIAGYVLGGMRRTNSRDV